MKCKKIEGLILTDYIDVNLKGRALEELERHLKSCPGCHALGNDMRTVGKLFEALPHETAPAGLWRNIRDEINAVPAKRYFPEIAFEYARHYLSYIKPAVVIASAAVLLLFALAVIRFMPYQGYLETTAAQDDILAISYSGDEEDVSEYDFGTPAETFFL